LVQTTMLDMDMGTQSIQLQPMGADSPGAYSGESELTMPGHWGVVVKVLPPGQADFASDGLAFFAGVGHPWCMQLSGDDFMLGRTAMPRAAVAGGTMARTWRSHRSGWRTALFCALGCLCLLAIFTVFPAPAARADGGLPNLVYVAGAGTNADDVVLID